MAPILRRGCPRPDEDVFYNLPVEQKVLELELTYERPPTAEEVEREVVGTFVSTADDLPIMDPEEHDSVYAQACRMIRGELDRQGAPLLGPLHDPVIYTDYVPPFTSCSDRTAGIWINDDRVLSMALLYAVQAWLSEAAPLWRVLLLHRDPQLWIAIYPTCIRCVTASPQSLETECKEIFRSRISTFRRLMYDELAQMELVESLVRECDVGTIGSDRPFRALAACISGSAEEPVYSLWIVTQLRTYGLSLGVGREKHGISWHYPFSEHDRTIGQAMRQGAWTIMCWEWTEMPAGAEVRLSGPEQSWTCSLTEVPTHDVRQPGHA